MSHRSTAGKIPVRPLPPFMTAAMGVFIVSLLTAHHGDRHLTGGP